MGPDDDTRVPPGHVLPLLLLGAAVEPVAWALLVGHAPAGPGWFGDGRLLAAVHLLTVGVVAASMLGAGWQLVPVVTTRRPRGFGLAPLVNALFVLALPPLAWGFVHPGQAVTGGWLLLAALAVRAVLVLAALARGQRPATRLWLAAGELCLIAGASLGGLLWASRAGVVGGVDPWATLHRHAALLLGGWVGGWVVGLGSLLVPMFAVAREPRPALLVLAAVPWFAGIVLGLPVLWAVGALIAVATLLGALAGGFKAGAPLLQVGGGLVGGLVGAGALLLGEEDLAVAAALVLGILPVVRGMAQRIVPFFLWTAWLSHAPARAPAAGTLLPARAAAVQAALSGVGAVLLLVSRRVLPGAGEVAVGLLLAGSLLHLGLLLLTLLRARRARAHLDAIPGLDAR